eukprot:Nk52_evm23s1129 gene=Nk52_evmTU23s1129
MVVGRRNGERALPVLEPCPHTFDGTHFYSCYLLRSLKPGCEGSTYIGFTCNPPRRIRQHNGEIQNGARKTRFKRPWEMILVVHGFPEEISALRFEWAWQNPFSSTRLKYIIGKSIGKRKSLSVEGKIFILSYMLNATPWCRLPLNVQWLNPTFVKDFPSSRPPPGHVRFYSGDIVFQRGKEQLEEDDSAINQLTERLRKSNIYDDEREEEEFDESVPDKENISSEESCIMCFEEIVHETNNWVSCTVPKCQMKAHLRCLSQWFLNNDPDQLIPVIGTCPCCKSELVWGNLILKLRKRGHDNSRRRKVTTDRTTQSKTSQKSKSTTTRAVPIRTKQTYPATSRILAPHTENQKSNKSDKEKSPERKHSSNSSNINTLDLADIRACRVKRFEKQETLDSETIAPNNTRGTQNPIIDITSSSDDENDLPCLSDRLKARLNIR